MTSLNQNYLEKYFYYINERYSIYQKKEIQKLPAPWTEDPILQSYSFTNVFREDDRTTRALDKLVFVPFADHRYLWFMCCLARQISWAPTINNLLQTDNWPVDDDWDAERAAEVMDYFCKTGEKVWTGAFMIRAESDKKAPWYNWSKARYVLDIVLGNLWRDRHKLTEFFEGKPTYQQTVELFATYYGIGNFMAKEFANDLLMTRYLKDAPDLMTWSAAGPGAIRGLNFLYGRGLQASLTQDEARMMMRYLQDLANTPSGKFVGAHVQASGRWPFTLERIQWNLCEFSKYMKVVTGVGKPRSGYPGRG